MFWTSSVNLSWEKTSETTPVCCFNRCQFVLSKQHFIRLKKKKNSHVILQIMTITWDVLYNSTSYTKVATEIRGKSMYLCRSHYPREHKWGTSFRALSQLHKRCVKCSFIWCIDQVKQAHDCYRYPHSRSIDCSNQRLREVHKLLYKVPVIMVTTKSHTWFACTSKTSVS